MRSRSRLPIVTCLAALLVTGPAWGQGDPPATDPAPSTGDPSATPAAEATAPAADEAAPDPNRPRYGAGLRLRYVTIPKFMLELFVERAGSEGVTGFGFGLEAYRRKGNFELQLAFEYEGLSAADGHWIDKGESPPADEVDFVEFESFGWFTLEIAFINHTPFNKYVALRYGGGAGIGILKGDVVRTDRSCSASPDNPNWESTCAYNGGPNNRNPYDLPPVFPVLTGFLGVQFTPAKNVVINLEGGLRTMFFFGLSGGYYFK